MLMKTTDIVAGAGIRLALVSSLLAGTAMLTPTMSVAQEAGASDADGQVNEILVTARRRSETLQEVPVAVSVVTSEELNVQNLNNVPELIHAVPAITLRPSGPKDTGLLIRGLGTITTSPGAEPTVSMVLDGVVLARPGQMVADLIDVDRVEVLRGPQGTLFGKNASAGVINITTKSPTPGFGGFVQAGYYTGEEYRLSGAVNGELAPGLLAARISGLVSDFDGNITNIVTGSEVNGFNRKGARLKLLFTPSPDLDILLSGDYLKSKATSAGVVYTGIESSSYPSGDITVSTTLPVILDAQGITPGFKNRETASDLDNRFNDEFYGISAQIDYALGEFELTSITGYRGWKSLQNVDTDGYSEFSALVPYRLVDIGHVDSTQFTQEIRLASPKGFIDYVVGLYYFHSKNNEDYRRDVTLLTAGGVLENFGFNDYSVTSNNYSAFGEANINFSDRLRAIVGARLVRDELRFEAERTSTAPVNLPGVRSAYSGEGSTDATDYAARLGVAFEPSDAVNTYFTYSRGYKGPAFNVFFNMIERDAEPLAPETSDSFELGLKSSLLNRQLGFNVALFYDKVKNYQANQPDVVEGSIVTRLINAGEVSTRGIEVEAIARPSRNLSFNADYAYVDAKIDSFFCPVGAAASCDVDGKPLPFAPKHKLALRGSYDTDLSTRLRMNVSANYTYQSSQQNSITQTPLTIAPGYSLLGGSITVSDEPSGWEATVMVKNALNKFIRSSYAQGNGGTFGGLPRDFERYFGFIVRKNF